MALKELNHTHSFNAGDRLLQRLADRMRTLLPSPFRIVRRGGGTFVVLMAQTDDDAALNHAERVRADIASGPITVTEGVRVTQTISVGVAGWNNHERAMTLLQRADGAMRDAKSAGRNRTILAPPPEDPA